jgi:hypothetical protein
VGMGDYRHALSVADFCVDGKPGAGAWNVKRLS